MKLLSFYLQDSFSVSVFEYLCSISHASDMTNYRAVFGCLPKPYRAWLLFIFLHQASQLSVYQSCDYHVYIPNTYALLAVQKCFF